MVIFALKSKISIFIFVSISLIILMQIIILNWITSLENTIKSSVPIVFVTPTAYRTEQKADLTRLAQNLAPIKDLFWIIVEDSKEQSPYIDELMTRVGINGKHLIASTPLQKKINITDPNWTFPRGIVQRNAALHWIRKNLANLIDGIIYFGDDDNTYDWRLFNEMRTIQQVGVWPVGIVGGQLVETPLINNKSHVHGFNAHWKPRRPFAIDMAGFAVRLSLIFANPGVAFTYESPRGFLESHFLESLGLKWNDLEPKAENCTRVYVWHTRTEKTRLRKEEMAKFLTKTGLDYVQRDAIF